MLPEYPDAKSQWVQTIVSLTVVLFIAGYAGGSTPSEPVEDRLLLTP